MKRPEFVQAENMTGPAGVGPVEAFVGAGELLAGLRRVCAFGGGFGSGKSEVAVNFAVALVSAGRRVRLADLDIVNPYFRSREAREPLRAAGVELLLPSEEMMSADMPVIPPEVRGALASGGGTLVLDLGGGPVGARVMASIADALVPGECDGMFVLNSRRPFTSTVAGAVRMMRDIERVSGLTMNRVVVNSHLIDETDAGVVGEGVTLAREVCAETGASVAFVAVERELAGRLDRAAAGYPLLLIDRRLLKPWEQPARPGSTGFRP
ncbi:MAG: cobalamin biosynthesis protein CbiA [bacterium]